MTDQDRCRAVFHHRCTKRAWHGGAHALGDSEELLAEVESLRSQLAGAVGALGQIRALWTHPKPAQRQDVAYQEAVRIASRELERLASTTLSHDDHEGTT